MALGFGFNKQKIMAAAEKAVQQGKMQNAINEYEKVVKEDPKDLTVLNTIGDLQARVGNKDKASVYFKRVGDIYATEGFTVKAIAVYKKIAKLNPSATDCVVKLAELYTQQGLYNDARQQYVVVADHYMKAGSLEDAAKVFQKILELDSENTAMQSKLADLYIKLNRKDDARNIFLKAAQSLYQRGALDAADEALRRVISLDPENMEALLLRGKIAADSGDAASAVLYLERVPDLDARPDALRALMSANLQTGKFDRAEELAKKLLTLHKDASGLTAYAEFLMSAGSFEAALQVYDQYSDRLLASNPAATMEALTACAAKISENPKALEMLRSIFAKTGEHSRINEVSEALANACVNSGDLPKAASIYKELAELEPENPLHLQNYKQIQGRLGKDPTVREVTKEEGSQALMVDELEHHAPALQQSYPDAVRDAVRAAITEAELFESYNMAAKAIAPLEAALPQAPNDAQINQRLASLYARAGRMQEAVERCQVLQSLYSEAGFADQARQYSEMVQKYRQRMTEEPSTAVASPAADAPPAGDAPGSDVPKFGIHVEGRHSEVAEFSVEAVQSEPAAPPGFAIESGPPSISQSALEEAASKPAPAASPTGAHEIDLSDWEKMTVEEHPKPAAQPGPELFEEAEFYIGQSLWKEAQEAIAKIQAAAPDSPRIAELQQRLAAAQSAAASAASAAAPQSSVAEFTFDAGPEAVASTPAPQVIPMPPPPAAPAAAAAATASATPVSTPPPAKKEKKAGGGLADFVLDLEDSLGDDFAISSARAKSAPPAAKSAPPVAAMSAAATPAVKAPAPMAAPPASIDSHPDASSTLSDMFAEFKEDVEESSDQTEDPDTHYNLGVAFKEMGLLDEAIGELQKVCHAIERGHPFSQVMQAYTWLAHCFLEKGAPEASVKWYEKALHVPAIDEDSKLAVYYELGSAHEAAGNKKAALQNFNEVYSNNIDYRDVAERIKALKA